MSEVLVIAEHRRGELSPATFELVAAAASLKEAKGGSTTVAVIAKDPDAFTSQFNVAGIDEVVKITVPVPEFQNDLYEATILALLQARNPAVVLTPHSVDAWSYAPAVAVQGNYGCATDVLALRYDGDDLLATRPAYSEKLHQELEFPGKATVVITIRGGSFKPLEEAGSPTVSTFEAPSVQPRTEHLKYLEPEVAAEVDISQAEYMLSIGRGVGEEDNVEQFDELADEMGFTLGCSRPIADNGWLPKYRQVGQSGKTVTNCKIYLALGVSGSVQHMAGMKHVPNIIAINKDPEASIFNIARYGVVGDMFDVAKELKHHFE